MPTAFWILLTQYIIMMIMERDWLYSAASPVRDLPKESNMFFWPTLLRYIISLILYYMCSMN